MHEGMPTLAIHPSILTFFHEIEILYHKFMYLLVLNKCTYFIREVIVLHQVLEKINIRACLLSMSNITVQTTFGLRSTDSINLRWDIMIIILFI